MEFFFSKSQNIYDNNVCLWNLILANIQNQVLDVSNQLAAAQGANSQNAQAIARLLNTVAAQDASINKLSATNGIWQSNFKVISNTFAKIKKRVLFTLPVLNLRI